MNPKKSMSAFFYRCMTLCLLTCLLSVCFLSPTILASAGKPHVPSAKIPVILDTDMGIDDWLALLYLLNRREVEILAITVPITGQSHCQAAIHNIHKLMDLSGKVANRQIPVACSQSYYTQQFVVPFPDKWRHEANTLAGMVLPYSARKSLAISAEQLIQEQVDKQAKLGIKPIIITLGPLTTMANILEKDPSFKHKISNIISMGGAVSVKGNIHYIDPVFYQNRVSEWNFYADPLAVKKVLESGVVFKMMPLDATDMVPLDKAFMRHFKRVKKTRAAEFIYGILNKKNNTQNYTGYCFWDSLTVAMALDSSMEEFKSLPIRVKYGAPNISGQTVVDHQKGDYVQVALSANAKRFHQDFLAVINR